MSDQVRMKEIKTVWQGADDITEEEYRARLWRVFRFLLQLSVPEDNHEPDTREDQEPGTDEAQ